MKHSLFVLAATIIGFIPAPSFSTIILDEVMSKDKQIETGVSKLSKTQKQVLEAWLNATFVLKTESVAKPQELFLSINIDSGHQIQLSDGSLWDIAPEDVERASVWITPFPVRIAPSHNSEYPQMLINGVSGESVKARPAKSVKQSPKPAQPSKQTPTPQATQPPQSTPTPKKSAT